MRISKLLISIFILTGVVAINGCVPGNNQKSQRESTVIKPEPVPGIYSPRGLALCQSESQALKNYDWQGYQRHKSTMDNLTTRSAKYLLIRQQLSEDMQSVMDSIYQAQLARYCQQIHTDLFNAMIAQADAA